MEKGMVGIALTQVASTELIRKTLNENAEFLATTIDSGFNLIHGDMQDVASGLNDLSCGINELRGDFNIAMGNALAQIELLQDEMQNGFKHISSILENRRKTDAQEYFEDALEFYKDGNRFSDEPQWFKDAKKYFLASIKLYTRNPLAHLYLGHIYHYQKEHRDFGKAFEHYRLSAVYGMTDKETYAIAAKGSFFAAWLQASVFKDMKEAISYSNKAIQLDPELPKAHYYLVKYHARAGNVSKAIQLLEVMITNDREYAIKVLLDPDFEPIKESVKLLLGRLKKEAISGFEKSVKEIRALLCGQNDDWYVEQSHELKEVVRVATQRDTYYDYLNATDFLNKKKNPIKAKISADTKKRIKEEQIRQEKEKANKERQLKEEQLRMEKEEKARETQAWFTSFLIKIGLFLLFLFIMHMKYGVVFWRFLFFIFLVICAIAITLR